MLTVTKEQKEKAIELGRKHNVDTMFVNDKGEFFTNENYAKLSVNSDKEKLAKVSITAQVEKAVTTTIFEKAEDIIAAIETETTPEAVQAILDAENLGKKRATVIAAAKKKLESLKNQE